MKGSVNPLSSKGRDPQVENHWTHRGSKGWHLPIRKPSSWEEGWGPHHYSAFTHKFQLESTYPKAAALAPDCVSLLRGCQPCLLTCLNWLPLQTLYNLLKTPVGFRAQQREKGPVRISDCCPVCLCNTQGCLYVQLLR